MKHKAQWGIPQCPMSMYTWIGLLFGSGRRYRLGTLMPRVRMLLIGLRLRGNLLSTSIMVWAFLFGLLC